MGMIAPGRLLERPWWAISGVLVIAVAVAAGWAYFTGGERRLEGKVQRQLRAWESAGHHVDSLPSARASRATTAVEVVAGRDTSQLVVVFDAGTWVDTYALRGVESAHAVGLLVLTRAAPGACAGVATFAASRLSLQAAIGNRLVYDTQSGQPLKLEATLPDRVPILEPGEAVHLTAG